MEVKKSKVLLIDDDPDVRQLLTTILAENYQVFEAPTGAAGIDMARQVKPDVILLDFNMPGISGAETCRILREDLRTTGIPTLMVTSLDQIDKRIEAFEAGADDYINKPFRADELLARMSSKIKRLSQVQKDVAPVIQIGKLSIHLTDHEVMNGDHAVDMGHVEFKILSLLARSLGEIILRKDIEDYIWGDEKPSPRALDPHITSLRKKLQGTDADLRTVYGSGYCLEARS
ncbi:MAG: response regulator transcription factor [Bdellovibrionota bacterium]